MSPTPPAVSIPSSRGLAVRRALVLAGLAVAVAVCFYSPVRQLADTTLDHSNYASYAYFTARGFQFGTEVVPMAGPLGFVPYGFLYAGNLFWKRLPLELLTKLVLGVLAVWFLRRTPGYRLRWLWLLTLCTMAPLVEDLPYDLAILLAGLCLLENHPAPGRRSLLIASGLAAYLALLTLFKGTQVMLAGATLALVVLQAVQQREYRRLPWVFGSYFSALLCFWMFAGQNPLHLPRYLHGVFELSSGYNAAMVLEEPWPAFLSGLGALLCLEILTLLLLRLRWRQPAALAGGLLLLGFGFLEWKHGFVRADGHVYIFFQFASIAALTVWLYFRPWAGAGAATPGMRLLAAGLAAAAFTLGIWSDGQQALARHAWALEYLPVHIGTGLGQILAPAETKAELDDAIGRQRTVYSLPLIREIVGNARIDFFGTELGSLILNRLNYRPRPMGGGPFNVFTPWLQTLNAQYLADPATRPDFYLVDLQTIDYRFLAQDDADTLRNLIALYAPEETEQGLVLFRARPDAPPPARPRFLQSRPVRLGQPLALPAVPPDEMLLVSLSIPPSWLGRLRGFLYKPALMFMDLEGEGIEEPHDRRVVPSMFVHPVLLNPVVENTRDLLALFQPAPGKTARRLVLHTNHPGCFAPDGLAADFYAVRRPPVVPAAERVSALLRFPVASELPASLEPPNAPLRRFDGLLVQMLEPPGRIRFALTGRENAVLFKYGIDPEAYTRGSTDGVEFLVELERPGQAPQIVFRRWLQPLAVPADRGTQTQRVVLPPFPAGAMLSLRTSPGPANNTAWDWGYFSGIRLLRGDYLPEQFPRFQTLPVAVEADMAGSINVDGRDLFMLNSPGSLVFSLQGTEKKLVFSAGLLPGAYTEGGNSDGVELIVELRTPDGQVEPIARRLLNPRDNAADRGDRLFEFALPPAPAGTRLMLTVSPGPAGNAAWDWSYIESLSLE
jgi:hypothetical protein